MIFLPVAERELRVASRKRSTFRVRVAAALFAVLIGSGFLVLIAVWPLGVASSTLGKGLFALLTWLSLAGTLSAGLFLTSDCLSAEKREETLGFLFLTDLRGYDVVLGKLLATSVRGVCALLAVFPILAVTLLMGGVPGAQFWKTSLALVNALILSLAAGLVVSALSRDSQKAMAMTLVVMVLLAGGGPAGDAVIDAVNQRGFKPVLCLSSPVYLFLTSGAWGRPPFWTALLVNQVLAGALFGLTCLLLPRTWQEKGLRTTAAAGSWAQWWRYGGAKRRALLRRKLADVNPVMWLACREHWQAVTLWLVTVLLVGTFAAIFAIDQDWLWFVVSSLAGGAVTLALYLGITSQAARFFVEARQSGLTELLLATPLTARQIVQGQWRALLRMFGLPLTICLVTQLSGAILVQYLMWNQFAAAVPPPAAPTVATTTNTMTVTNTTVVTTATGPGTMTVSMGGFGGPNNVVMLASSVGGTLTVAANLVALIWFGMWMGLNSKTTNIATLKTLLFVQVIPWFALTFASMLAVPLFLLPGLMKGGAVAPSSLMGWYPLLSSALMTMLCLAKDLAFVLWSRKKLYLELRERLAPAVSPIRPVLPPPLPRAAQPPVIAPTE